MVCTVAVDAMGGDRAPSEVVLGSVQAARARPDDFQLLLVGKPDCLEAELRAVGWNGANVEVVPAHEVIGMGDSPIVALRKKKGSSIEIAMNLVRDGRADAVISAGNTGACVAAGTIRLGLLPEVRRAGIAVIFTPGPKPVVAIDVGANINAKPEQLLQYGIMASLYAREIIGVESPRVGLLNIGEEVEKGTSLAKATNALFTQSALNYAGNIEGVDIFRGGCDVAVCEGFLGNVVLKVSEGLAECLLRLFKEGAEGVVRELAASQEAGVSEQAVGKVQQALTGALAGLLGKVDYSEFGGAPLLGVNGVVIIAHGRSDAKAIANAIHVSQRMAEADLNRHITEEIRAFSGQKEAS